MACPACGCKECHQYNGWGDDLDDTEGWERCAACGAIFPDATPDYRESWEYHMDNARIQRRRELHGI